LQNTLTKYKEDQVLNRVKSHESTKPNINSTIKTAAEIMEELRQLNENSATKQEEMQHSKPRLGACLKKKNGRKRNAGPVHYEHK
jgi:hypothetical protein